MLNATMDSTLDSAVILADLVAGRGIAKKALRGATKKVADKAASKVVKKRKVGKTQRLVGLYQRMLSTK